ncbi:MAG: hypothetical protein GXP32_02795 [Kiritimatiellaeota bacterium]|nr:hypothetical protein [Kiritimatiellota bacterium]
MNRRERLMSTLRGESVDRPAVSFYEINGTESMDDTNPFNIYSDPSWKPLIELALHESDRIVMRNPGIKDLIEGDVDKRDETTVNEDENGSRITTSKITTANGKILTQTYRRDRDVNTEWCVEHLLKDVDDFKAWIDLPEPEHNIEVNAENILELERELGDSGIVMLDTPDPLCRVAPLFDMAEYTITALTEPELTREALDKVAEPLYRRVKAVCEALPGRLWRIYGPEYASPPYLPPYLFKEYVTEYVKPMAEIINATGGYARIHSHGNLKDILDHIAEIGCDAIDPIEPPEQGDVTLKYVREKYGDAWVLFGNLEITDIENMPTAKFADKVRQAIDEGTAGDGRGFVLMPSACPYGRKLSPLAVANYEKMIELTRK